MYSRDSSPDLFFEEPGTSKSKKVPIETQEKCCTPNRSRIFEKGSTNTTRMYSRDSSPDLFFEEPGTSKSKKDSNESQVKFSPEKNKKIREELLTELYGEKWKSVPNLLKPTPTKSNDEHDKENDKPSSAIQYNESNIGSKSVMTLNEIRKEIDQLAEEIEKATGSRINYEYNKKRLGFMASLADDVPANRCNPEALRFRNHFHKLKDKVTQRLYEEFNREVFDNQLDADMTLLWDNRLKTTAGRTDNKIVINKSTRETQQKSSIVLSTKILDNPEKIRNTLIHEMCHAAVWTIDKVQKDGHGPLWKKWTARAENRYPELGEITVHHNFEIQRKFRYICTECGFSIPRQTKSLDVTKIFCTRCRGSFKVVYRKKTKNGDVWTVASKGKVNNFALYVKENYRTLKQPGRTHAEVMKMLGEQYRAKKNLGI